MRAHTSTKAARKVLAMAAVSNEEAGRSSRPPGRTRKRRSPSSMRGRPGAVSPTRGRSGRRLALPARLLPYFGFRIGMEENVRRFAHRGGEDEHAEGTDG